MAKSALDVAQHLLPHGKRHGQEWKAGSVSGEEGASLSVRIGGAKAGLWSDFATGQKGDLIDLWLACRNQSIAEAMREAKRFLGINDSRLLHDRPRSYRRPTRPKCSTPKSVVKDWLHARGMTDKTLADFRIGEQIVDGKSWAIFPYLRDGELVNIKYRNPAEKRDMRQESDAEPCLFGWHLVDPKCRQIAIAEGEIDCMTLHQAGIAALSVNAGAGNHQWIENDWNRLERFSDIVLFFDSDEPGQKGAREVANRLGIDRCRIARLPAKDANEYLQQGAENADFWHTMQEARALDPEELRPAIDFLNEVKAMFYPASEEEASPLLQLDRSYDFFRFRRGEVTIWSGYNGHGKSLILSQIMLGLIDQGERFTVFSGEMSVARQMKRLMKQATGLDRPTSQYMDAVAQWVNGRLWFFNVLGNVTINRLLEVFQYARRRYGVSHFVIDSLMMTDVPEDGSGAMTAQKEAMRRICTFARVHDVHLHLVAHPRKGQDESRAPGKQDVAGSNKITAAADNVFTVWSRLADESAPPTEDHDARLELCKQRNGDVQHKTLVLWFNRAAQQFVSSTARRSYHCVQFSGPIVTGATA